MSTFSSRSRVAQSVEDVYAWHRRPGVTRRLLPPWEPLTVAAEPPDRVDGTETVVRLAGPARVAPRWVLRHTGCRPPGTFTDVQTRGPFAEWIHRHTFEPAEDGGTLVGNEVRYRSGIPDRLLASRLRRAFAYRARQLAADLAAHAGTEPRTVVLTGGSGLIGTALGAFLTTGGHRVIRLVRREPRFPDESRWDPAAGLLDAGVLRGADAVIHLAGEPIAGRFTAAHRDRVLRSRVTGTALLARTLAELGDAGPATFVSSSAIGYYGAARGAPVDEDAEPGDDFLARLCRRWEAATEPARDAGRRVVLVRTGVVQSPAGGALRAQLPLFLAGVGGRLGTGDQWLSWVSIDDIVGILHHVLLHEEISGPVNGVAPNPVRNAEYTATLGAVVRRPTRLPTPAFGPRLLLGAEGTRLTALASQNVHSGVLARTGYRFRQPDLETCLRHVLGRGIE